MALGERLKRFLALLTPALLLLASGCSAADVYGEQLRYAPSFRAYVLAPNGASDDPDPEDARILRDPITARKIRCREDVEKWADAYRRDATDRVHDEAWEIASPILMAPAALGAGMAIDVAVVMVAVAGLPYTIARSEDAESVYLRGEEAFAADRWDEAARLFELALVKDGGLGTAGLTTYYLGIAYANLGRSDEARETLAVFVERSGAQEVTAYRNAERWLRYLGEPIQPCRSQDPVRIRW